MQSGDYKCCTDALIYDDLNILTLFEEYLLTSIRPTVAEPMNFTASASASTCALACCQHTPGSTHISETQQVRQQTLTAFIKKAFLFS